MWYVEILKAPERRFVGPFKDLLTATEFQGAARRAIFGQRSGLTVGPIRAVSARGEEFPGMLRLTAGIPAGPGVGSLTALFGGCDATQDDLGDSAGGGGAGDLGADRG